MRLGSVGLAVSVAAFGCVLTNPAFDDTEGTRGASTTGASTTSTTATTVASDGGGETTVGGASTDTTGEATTAITTADMTTTTTGGPTDCWASQSPWIVAEFAPADLGDKPRSFRFDADGLGLTYSAGVQGDRMPHRATRATRDEPFTGAAQIAAWDGLGGAVDEAALVGQGELFVAVGVDKVNGADLMVSLWDGASWPSPQPIGPAINVDTANDRTPNLSADGTRLVFERNGGPLNSYFDAAVIRIYEAKRPLGGDPLAEFGAPVELALPPMTDDPDVPLITCPTLSADGRHLFFGSSYPTPLSPETIVGAVEFYEAERASVDDPWGAPLHHAELHFDGLHSCPRTVTADGCELLFEAFFFSLEEGSKPELDGFYLARRDP